MITLNRTEEKALNILLESYDGKSTRVGAGRGTEGFDFLHNNIPALKKLEAYGYIAYLAPTMGFVSADLTEDGIYYFEDKALHGQPSARDTTVNIYGDMNNSQIQQNTQNSSQVISASESVDFDKALEIFSHALNNLESFPLSNEDKEQLKVAISEATPIAENKSNSTLVKKSLLVVKDIMLRATGSLAAQGILFGLQQMGMM